MEVGVEMVEVDMEVEMVDMDLEAGVVCGKVGVANLAPGGG